MKLSGFLSQSISQWLGHFGPHGWVFVLGVGGFFLSCFSSLLSCVSLARFSWHMRRYFWL